MFKGIGKQCDLRSSQDAIKVCGLDWKVYKGAIRHTMEDGTLVDCPRYAGVFREDNNHNLGIVGADYSLAQNSEAASLADAILDEDASIRIRNGAEIFGGDKMFLNLQLGDLIRIGSEKFKRIIMLAWAHDGGLALTARFFLVRNSTNAILAIDSPDVTTSIKIRHSGNIADKINEAKGVMKKAYAFFENIESKMEILSITPLEDGSFKQMLSKLFPEKVEKGNSQTRAKNNQNEVFGLYNGEHDTKGTKLGGLLAITEYCNSVKSTRVEKGKNSDEVEFNGIVFGTRTAEINKIFKMLLDS